MPDFSPVIESAYEEILGPSADRGLAHYNGLMNRGLSEARLREELLRSAEYAERNPEPGFSDRVGLNVHVPPNEILEDIAFGLGVHWIRVDFDWFRMEPQQGRFAWEETDRVIEGSRERGLEVLATLAYTPAWASSNPGNHGTNDPPASIELWRSFVRASVSRYRERVRFWQFWNEPNLSEFWNGSMLQYRVSILEEGARTAKSVAPSSRVVAPGLANVGAWRDWFQEAIRAKGFIDVVNHHSYASTGRASIVELRTDRPFQTSLRTLMRENGVDDRPFWLTETGRRTADGDQPRYYQEVLATLRAETWVSRLFFFHYWDGPGQGNGGFGIVNEDFSYKPAYFVLQTAMTMSSIGEAELSKSTRESATAGYAKYTAGFVRLHRPGAFPMLGREAVAEFVASSRLTVEDWEGIDGGIAASGELGYTYGRYGIRLSGAAETGHFTNVWKRDAEGEWQLVAEVMSPVGAEAR
jgi:hypothetical protein